MDIYYFDCPASPLPMMTTLIFSGDPPFPHSWSMCPRQLDLSEVNQCIPSPQWQCFVSGWTDNESGPTTPFWAFVELSGKWLLDSVGPSMVRLWPLCGRATTWSPGLKCSRCGTKTADKFKFWAATSAWSQHHPSLFSKGSQYISLHLIGHLSCFFLACN